MFRCPTCFFTSKCTMHMSFELQPPQIVEDSSSDPVQCWHIAEISSTDWRGPVGGSHHWPVKRPRFSSTIYLWLLGRYVRNGSTKRCAKSTAQSYTCWPIGSTDKGELSFWGSKNNLKIWVTQMSKTLGSIFFQVSLGPMIEGQVTSDQF